jgi:hypothetical protein
MAGVGAGFSGTTTSDASFGMATLVDYLPSSASASRSGSTSCDVSWSPIGGVPTPVRYGVLDGGGAVLASGISGSSVTVTVPVTQVVIQVRTEAGGWVSSSTVSTVCPGAPDPPTGVAAVAGDTTAQVSWTAPAQNGGSPVTSFTVTGVPTAGSGFGSLPTRTCSVAAPTTSCSLTGLTNGVTYAVSVTATNAYETGPASVAATVLPYPSSLFVSSSLKVWLESQHAGSLSAAGDCSGSNAATGTGIGCWKDRSGNAWNAVSGATKPALTASAINGHPAIRFARWPAPSGWPEG